MSGHRSPSRRWTIGGFLIAAAAIVAWFVFHIADLGGRPLTIAWGFDPAVYDPQRTSNPVAYEVFRHVCEPLFWEDQSGDLRGWLAEDDVAYSEDDRQLIIRLRPDIYFHDGEPLTPAAVVQSFRRLQTLQASPLTPLLDGVQFEALDDERSVRITLPIPDYEYPRRVLANAYSGILSPRTTPETRFVACTGPYQFDQERYKPNQSITLPRFASYHHMLPEGDKPIKVRIPEVEILFEADAEQRLRQLENGRICVLSLDDPAEAAQLESEERFHTYNAWGGITYLGFNFLSPTWQNTDARRAVAQAVDSQALAISDAFVSADTIFTPPANGYNERAAAYRIPYNPAQSAALLSDLSPLQARRITLSAADSPIHRRFAQEIQGQLHAVGIDVTVQAVPYAEIIAGRHAYDLLLFDYAWWDYTAVAAFLGPGPRNLLAYPESDAAELIFHALGTADAQARQDVLLQLQKLIADKVIWKPLVMRRLSVVVDGRCVQGEITTRFGELYFHTAATQ